MTQIAAVAALPPLWGCVVAAVIYWFGSRPPVRVTTTAPWVRAERRRRAIAFYGGLLVIVAALCGPMDEWSDTWFWAHMTQHLLLVMVAAPLLVMGAPWLAPWRLIGHRARVGLTRTVGHGRAWAPVRGLLSPLTRPVGAWLLFNITLLGWHLPALYNLTLLNPVVHDFEHLMLLGAAVLFWAQVIDSPPLRARLDQPQRVAYLTLAAVAGWVLALALSLPSTPIYSAYVDQHGASAASAVRDQQLAAGVMWVPGSIAYSIGVFVAIYRWVDDRKLLPTQRVAQKPRGLAGDPR
jgi:putative membrane protein